ncbi:MAG: hypothetical protein C0497_12870 [Gemmatimonas sp.]|nr:hypothetical protein [Gemmatimonas sp.]
MARTNQVVAARNEAYEAYYRHVLYLPEDVEVLALEVCYAFHRLLGEYVAPHADHFLKQGEARDMLRGSMVKLQHAARAELARAKPE